MSVSPSKKVFRSRVSVLLVVFILAVFVPIILRVIHEIPALIVLGVTFLFILFIFTGMRYIVAEGKLWIKLWFISMGSIDVARIRSVRRSYNPLSSPAASLKRLSLSFSSGGHWIDALISPVREREFIEALKAVNPDIRVDVPEKKGFWRIWDWDI
jgi:hypothetical protein